MRSIGLKLWVGMMSLVAVVLLLLWFFQIVFLESFYTRMRITEIKSRGYTIIEEMRDINRPAIEQLEAFSYNNNLSIELLDEQGNVIYESSAGGTGNGPMMRNNVRRELFGEVLGNKEKAISLIHPRFGNNFMLIGLPVQISGQNQGVMFINMPLAPVEETAAILKRQLVYITLALLVVASVVSLIISKTFTKPILEIKGVSEKMASGDFSDRIEIKNKDEIGLLAETINFMGAELAKIEQLRKELIANVSHELRTPLSLIRGYAETIRDVTGNKPEKRNKQLGVIIEESERLSWIVDDMLNLSQMQAGYIELDITSFSLKGLIEHITEKYNLLSEKNGVAISVKKNNGEFVVKADRARIEQVLNNLLNNALNHTNEGGSISVNLIDKDKSIVIEVVDTGVGIPQEELKHIWDRYYKTNKANRRGKVGTGLGLAIVKSILDAHKALYGVESRPGAGTKFWFELKKY